MMLLSGNSLHMLMKLTQEALKIHPEGLSL